MDVTTFAKGPNWFSITGQFAQYILENVSWIYTHFDKTKCADEIFLQTLAVNSPFESKLVPMHKDDNLASLRLIDWNRGTPYTWTESDIELITHSEAIFARKFNMNRNPELIQAVCEIVLEERPFYLK